MNELDLAQREISRLRNRVTLLEGELSCTRTSFEFMTGEQSPFAPVVRDTIRGFFTPPRSVAAPSARGEGAD
jgi:hypothetical protein